MIILQNQKGDETLGYVRTCNDTILDYGLHGHHWTTLRWLTTPLKSGWAEASLTTDDRVPQFYRVFVATPISPKKQEIVAESKELIEELRDQEARMYLHTSCPACEQTMLLTIPDSSVRCGGCGGYWALSFKLKLSEGL
jgi:ribosomal protein S27E